MASVNTSVADAARWRKWRTENPDKKNDYPNVASFLKNFPTPAGNYQASMNAKGANTKKGSFKNRVKGLFSKVGSRFSKKKNAKQANKNFVAATEVQELNNQTKQLKNLLQRQVENAGDLNMNNETKKVIQDNIETTRKLIEARQQELTSREAKDKLEELKKNVASVGKVVEAAPTSANASNASNASKLGNVSELKAAAVNALKRMGGMNGVAEQIAALKKMIEDCCEENGMGRGRSGSAASVGTNNRASENGKEEEATNSGSGAPGERPNFLERMPTGLPRPRPNVANNRPNLFEPLPKGIRPRNVANEPSPAGLFGSNNVENEPNPRGLFGSNNVEDEAPRNNGAPRGLPAGNNRAAPPPNASPNNNRAAPPPNAPPNNNRGATPNAPQNNSARGRLLRSLGLNANATNAQVTSAFRKASLKAGRNGTRENNNYKGLTSLYADWREERNSAYAEGNVPAEEAAYAGEGINEAAAREAAAEAEMEARAAARRAAGSNRPNAPAANNGNASPAGLFGSNNFENEPRRAAANNGNASPAGLFGSNNFENEPAPSPAPAPAAPGKKKLTMNNLTANERARVRNFQDLNNSISNNNALNLIRQEREQTAARGAKKGGKRLTRRNKRRITRKSKSRKNRK